MIWFLPWDGDHPSRHLPWATWSLMAINIAVFLLMPRDTDARMHEFFMRYGLVAGDWHLFQFVTGAFLHGGWMHLIGNLFFLWIFGDNVEDALGIGGFLALYFLGGFLGDVVYLLANAEMVPAIGASGCIAAVAGAYAALFHGRSVQLKVILLVFPVYTLHLRAIVLLLLFFGLDVWRTMDSGGRMDGGGVNFVAHGIGFLVGLGGGFVAAMHGTMRRFEALPNGDTWWGYLPARLEEEARAARLREARARQVMEQSRLAQAQALARAEAERRP